MEKLKSNEIVRHHTSYNNFSYNQKTKIFDYFLVAGIEKNEIDFKMNIKDIYNLSPRIISSYCDHNKKNKCKKNSIINFLNNL